VPSDNIVVVVVVAVDNIVVGVDNIVVVVGVDDIVGVEMGGYSCL
jgi:hypothetical protein